MIEKFRQKNKKQMTAEDIKNRISIVIEPNITDIISQLKTKDIDTFIYEIVKSVHYGIENFKQQRKIIR